MSTIRKIKVLNYPEEKEEFYCNLCKYPILSNEDFEHKSEGTCNECYLTFIECRKEEWKKGWRPEKSSLDSYILLRKNMNKKEIK
jgi:hypothetical protein